MQQLQSMQKVPETTCTTHSYTPKWRIVSTWTSPWYRYLCWSTPVWPAEWTAWFSHYILKNIGWILAGSAGTFTSSPRTVASHHIAVASGDNILCRVCEIEENPRDDGNLSPEEHSIMQHLWDTHTRTNSGRFVVPLPKNQQAKPLGEYRSQAVRRFFWLDTPCIQRINSQSFLLWWRSILRCNMQSLSW